MWAHYADGHTGICVELRHAEGDLLGGAQPVTYSKERPQNVGFETSSEESVENTLLTKAAGWDYEREWRRFELDRGPSPYEFPSRELTGIIFGVEASDYTREVVLSWVDRNPTPVAIYQAQLNKHAFHIDLVQYD